MSRAPARRWCLAAAVLALAAYVNVLPNDLVWDSDRLCLGCTGQPGLALKLLWPPRWEANRQLLSESYRPAALVSFLLERQLWGERAWGFHLTNVLLHALNAALVCWLARRLGWSARASWAAGAVFAVHPITTEAVAWVSNRSVLLATGCGLGSMGLFVQSVRGGRGRAAAAGSAVLLLLGLLANEGIGLLPLFAAGWLLGQGEWRRHWRRAAVLAGVAGAYLALRFAFTSVGMPPALAPPSEAGGPRVLLVLRTLKAYGSMLLWPWGLCADRPLHPVGWATSQAAVSVLFGVGLAAALVAGWRRRWGYGLVWWLACAAPVSNAAYLAGRPLAEQRAYLMAVGLALAAGLALRRRVGLAVALCVALGLGAIWRNREWATELALWRSAAAAAPTQARVFLNLGLAQERLGCRGRPLWNYRRATLLSPGYELARMKWASLVASEGRYADAIRIYEFVSPRDRSAEYWAMLGTAYAGAGRLEQATAAWQRALELAPGLSEPRVELARALRQAGQSARARKLLENGIERAPRDPALLTALGRAHLEAGETNKALRCFVAAARLDRKSFAAGLGLGETLAAMGAHKKAVTALQLALIVNPYSAHAYRLLAKESGLLGREVDQRQYEHAAQRLE